jgi:hypothetical protein
MQEIDRIAKKIYSRSLRDLYAPACERLTELIYFVDVD